MADEPRRRGRPKKHDPERDRDWCRPVDPGLSLQPPHPQGGGGDTGVRAGAGDGAHPPLRDDGVRGSGGGGRPPEMPGNGGGLRAGDDRDREDRARLAAYRLSAFENRDRPQFPDVEDRYRGRPAAGTAVAAEPRLCEGDVVSADTSKFDRITDKALDTL